ncbi:MAG: EMC3/TMCO1 family protein [Candidatus Woesearchaeota archaeon]
MAFLDFIFDPLFMPLLSLPSFVAILIISFVITLIITLVYMKFTDQSMLKSLKEEIKGYQTEMKKNRDNPEKLLKIQKKAMEANLKYMSHTIKPTLITLIPIVLIFSWLNAHFTYQPITAEKQFTITAEFAKDKNGEIELIASEGVLLQSPAKQNSTDGKIEWLAKAQAGTYELKYNFEGRELSQPLRVNSNNKDKLYEKPTLTNIELGLSKDSKLKSITIGNEKLHPFGGLIIFGWQPGWLATYIILSIIFSMGLRKLLKIY